MKESLFIYMDDTEYSIRLKKNDVPIIYEPRAILYHRVSGGLAMKDYTPFYLYHITRNRIYITDSPVYRTYLFCINLLYSVLRLCFYLLLKRNRRKRYQICAILRGFRDSLRPEKYGFFPYKWE
jgi:GT2 family glycosyltransferase